jgi:hypothetical protein
MRAKIAAVFSELEKKAIITTCSSGMTQKDGFDDCVSIMDDKGLSEGSIIGFCFVTAQDIDRARSYAQLPISLWGSPDGNDEATLRVGEALVEALKREGMEVVWDATAGSRPIVLL